jgi:NAD(P)-dependent dehydrogenase (short-subunit alcohol dehydrogenase family)
MSKLTGKVAVITGGSTGMGLATARLFVAEGARVIITGRSQETLDAAVADIGHGLEAVQGDISKLDDLARLHDYVQKAYGRIDILFANAGGGVLGPLGVVTETDFDRTVDTNFKGTFFTVQTLLPLIPDGGSIILNTSVAGSSGLPDFSVYSATKAAIRSLARTWTTDLKARRIRVNALAPGQIDTEIMRTAGLTQDQVDGFIAQVVPQIPLGRMGRSDEIAKVVLFLGSDDSSYVTGIELTVDGGWMQV